VASGCSGATVVLGGARRGAAVRWSEQEKANSCEWSERWVRGIYARHHARPARPMPMYGCHEVAAACGQSSRTRTRGTDSGASESI